MERYLRNKQSISEQQQELLAQRHVIVLGCGGLGIIDALDNFETRRMIEEAELDIPIISAAVAGYNGWLTMSMPGYRNIKHLCSHASKGVEQTLGNLSFTVNVLAELEVSFGYTYIIRGTCFYAWFLLCGFKNIGNRENRNHRVNRCFNCVKVAITIRSIRIINARDKVDHLSKVMIPAISAMIGVV
jgi:hypothetical protein